MIKELTHGIANVLEDEYNSQYKLYADDPRITKFWHCKISYICHKFPPLNYRIFHNHLPQDKS